MEAESKTLKSYRDVITTRPQVNDVRVHFLRVQFKVPHSLKDVLALQVWGADAKPTSHIGGMCLLSLWQLLITLKKITIVFSWKLPCALKKDLCMFQINKTI